MPLSQNHSKNTGFPSVLLRSSSGPERGLPRWLVFSSWGWQHYSRQTAHLWSPLCCSAFLSVFSLSLGWHPSLLQTTHPPSISFILLPSWTWKAQSINYSISINYELILSREQGKKMDQRITFYCLYSWKHKENAKPKCFSYHRHLQAVFLDQSLLSKIICPAHIARQFLIWRNSYWWWWWYLVKYSCSHSCQQLHEKIDMTLMLVHITVCNVWSQEAVSLAYEATASSRLGKLSLM